MPKASSRTFASGARQFVVHEAFEMMFWVAGSYSESLTPMTKVPSTFFAGAEMTTFFAPPSMWALAFSPSVKNPVDSTTTSTPRSPQGSLAGSRSSRATMRWPSTEMDSSS